MIKKFSRPEYIHTPGFQKGDQSIELIRFRFILEKSILYKREREKRKIHKFHRSFSSCQKKILENKFLKLASIASPRKTRGNSILLLIIIHELVGGRICDANRWRRGKGGEGRVISNSFIKDRSIDNAYLNSNNSLQRWPIGKGASSSFNYKLPLFVHPFRGVTSSF